MSEQIIEIARDYSPYPAGRYRRNSDSSGEEFRERFLIPALKKGGVIHVRFAGTSGYPASFVEEAFGGLVRSGFGVDELERRLKLEAGGAEYEVYVLQAWQYIRDAATKH